MLKRTEEFKKALDSGTCIWCGRPITPWKKFCRLFWAPFWCSISIFWKYCCSKKCYGNLLEEELRNVEKTS